MAYFLLWWPAYNYLNRYASTSARSFHLTAPNEVVPGIIIPWTAVIYVAGGVFLTFLPFAYNRDRAGIRFVLCCYTLTSALAFACYYIWPLYMVRPIYSGYSLGERIMRWVFSVDMPGNCCPSSHVFFATLSPFLVARGGAGWRMRWATGILAVAVCITTVTTGQHYFMDIPAGVAAALFGYGGACLMMRADGGAARRARACAVGGG